jgi:predicted DsbA family dithiol-disulfide isomerase
MGIDIKLPTVSPQPYTALAFEGLLFAQERGKGNAYNSAVMQAFFQRDLNIGSIDVLEEIASEVGLPSDEFRRALESGAYREQERRLLRHAYAESGVTGVPLFVIGDLRLVGLQDRHTLEEAIARAASTTQ